MHQLARLRWQCRRGTKELDFLLLRYLDSGYLVADEQEQTLFVELLKFEDDELIGVLLGELELETGEMKALVEKLKVIEVARV